MKTKSMALMVLLCLAIPLFASSQPANAGSYLSKDSISRKGYTLIYINKAEDFNPEVGERLKETFFEVYPELVKQFNKKSTRKVTFVIDPDYDGVAATSADKVVYSPKWFAAHPGDIDVVTHEVMHIVQAYGRTPGPWWVTEGIADYVRFKYGVDNAGAGWSLPELTEKHHYTNSYRITARFFVWLEKHKDEKLIKKIDQLMRGHSYRDESWKELTGQTIDELWDEYRKNAAI
ncbi:basic secretory protein-like protein [Gaoshiqia sp. Z1-71]|uniref:basic secretory protein-like protein n=1 Tax=Gaoshiqia hydrogeniformans TaxID=3290090 RepID=UPI003BF7868E